MTVFGPLPAQLHRGDTLTTLDLPVTLDTNPTAATLTVNVVRAVTGEALIACQAGNLADVAGSGPWTATLRYAWQSADTATADPGLYLATFSVNFFGGAVQTFPASGGMRVTLLP